MSGEPRTRRGLFGRGSGSGEKRSLGLSNPLVQITFFVVFTVGVVLLTNVNQGISPLQVTQEAIGEPALADVKATRDFSFVQTDPEATERKRAEAASSVPSVYDHHVDMREQLIAHVRKAFADVRGPLEEAEAELLRNAGKLERPAPPTPRDPPPAPDAPREEPDAGAEPDEEEVPAEAPEPVRAALGAEALKAFRVRTSEAMRDNFNLAIKTVVISDDDFRVLAEHGFPRGAEEALVSLLDSIMQRRVVADRRLLEVEGRGILLRRVRYGQVEQATKIYDIDESFLSLTDLHRELEILAPGKLREVTDPVLRQTIVTLVGQLSSPNTVYNHAVTVEKRDEARAGVQDLGEQESFRRGQIILRAGQIITPRHVHVIAEMEGTGDARLARGQILFGTLIAVLAMIGLFYTFSRANISKFRPAPRDMVLMGTLLLLELGLLQGLKYAFDRLGENWTTATPEMLYYAIPLAFGAMIVRLVNNSETAMVFSIIAAVLAGLAVDQSLSIGAFVLTTSLMGAHSVGKVCHRLDLFRAGVLTGLAGAVMGLAIFMLHGEGLSAPCLGAIIGGFVGGLVSGIIVNALLPLVESGLDYTTDIKLLELADLNHPAIKELILKAPGTYHHSVIVGTLAKEAAEAINANPLLARVGAYYHDIGKGKNPQYFAENQRAGNNPHDKLKPNMSALIIKAHVKDGLELARQHKLPNEIQDFIAMHHGTTLIAYFYHRAKMMEDPDIPEVDEKDYRYPGPRPQTRETAIVMLADGIEAASRAMPEPTPARLKGLVQKMVNQLFADGQLDECNLTLKDLNAIAKAFIRVLTSMYYTRPQYPGQEKNPGAKASQRRKESHSGEFKRSDLSQTGERRRKGESLEIAETVEIVEGKEPRRAPSEETPERPEVSSEPQEAPEVEKVPMPLEAGQDLLESALDFGASLPPMDLGLDGGHIRLTGPMPPIEQMLEAVKAEAHPAPEQSRGDEPEPPARVENEQDEEDDAPDADAQPTDRGDEVGDEAGSAAVDPQDKPSLRRLGLS